MKIFVGWSDAAGELVAKEVIKFLKDLRGWAEPKPWTQFGKGVTIWEEILGYLSSVDAAILIATPQDKAEQRGESRMLPRDNIILEYGLFVGALTRDRVLLLVAGRPDLPTDLFGINHAQLQLPSVVERSNEKFKRSVAREVRHFIQRIRCSQRADAELRRVVSRMPKPHALLPDIFWGQCTASNYPKYSDEDFHRVVRASTIKDEMRVGSGPNPPRVQAYVDFSNAADTSQECLATRLADAVVSWLTETGTRPSKIALLGRPDLSDHRSVRALNARERGTTRGLSILAEAVGYLGYPVLFVDTDLEDPKVLGHIDPDDSVVIIHDVVLSGQKPVRAACALRKGGARANHLFSLVVNPSESVEALKGFLEANQLTLHYKTAVTV